jgi:concanavalin A-like lectin/glucanase superfamily protein
MALAITLAAMATAATADAPPAPSLLAEWRFDEGTGLSATDTTGGGHDGQLRSTGAGDPPAWVTGHNGRPALAFDGSPFVAVSDTPALEPKHVGVEAWVRRSGSPGRWRYVVAKGAVSCDRSSYGLYSSFSGGLAFYVSGTGGRYVRSPEAPSHRVWDGAWHHVVGSYDGSHVALSIDGATVGDGTHTMMKIAYGTASKGVYIGIYRGTCDLPFTGQIDDVRIWDGPPPPGTHDRPGTITPVDDTGAANDAGGDPASADDADRRPVARTACVAIRLNHRFVRAGKRTTLVATVHKGGRAVPRVRLLVSGRGVRVSGRTSRAGKARLVIRAARRGRLVVSVRGGVAACATRSVRVL